MPKLKEVITAILSSLSSAQHQSNLVSAELSKDYQKDEILKYFALPNATVSEAEITLRYAIKDVATTAMPNLFSTRDVSSESRFAAYQRASKIIDFLTHNEIFQALFKSNDIKASDITTFCQMPITQAIYYGNKNSRNESEITKEIVKIFQKSFAKKTDDIERDQSLFQKPPFSNEIIKKIHTYIKGNFNNINNSTEKAQETSPKPKDVPYAQEDIEIIIDNDILQKLPENIIQTMHFKACNKNYHWLESENFSSGEFISTNQG